MLFITIVQAQQRYVDRVMNAHAGHQKRVKTSATKQLKQWAREHGLDDVAIHKDADDILALEILCQE